MDKELAKKILLLGLTACIVLVSLFYAAFILRKQSNSKIISPAMAANKVLNIVNTYFVPAKDAMLSGKPTEESGLYKVNLTLNNNTKAFYLTKDGGLLIFPNGIIDIAKFQNKAKENSQIKQEEIPKAQKPVIELFVMSLCPYGAKAQKQMLPLIESFGDKVNFKIKFIVNVNGDNINEVSSLHGIDEAKEDARQIAIMKYYPEKFSTYINEINESSCSTSSKTAKSADSWKATAKKLKMDIKKIENFVYSQESISLLKQNEIDAKKYGADASPTLIINGVKSSSIYQGQNALKEAICSAFLEPCDACTNSK